MIRALTYEYVNNYIENEGYELLSDSYINSKTKLKLKCSGNGHDDHIFEKTFSQFRDGYGKCRFCRKLKKYNFAKKYISDYRYTLLSKTYINSKTNLEIQCDKNHIYQTTFNVFQRGNRCPYCFGSMKLTHGYVENYINSYRYKLISKYINNRAKLDIECTKGHKYKVTFNSFKDRKSRCPICDQEKKDSQGVKLILEYLQNNNIKFQREYLFNNCKGIKRSLPFDFAVFKNNQINLIEFQGKQHYDNKNSWNINISTTDRVKADYCKNNSISFIAIPYNDDHIIGTLHNFIQNIKWKYPV